MSKVWNVCSKSWRMTAEFHVKKLHIVLEFRGHLPMPIAESTVSLNAFTNCGSTSKNL